MNIENCRFSSLESLRAWAAWWVVLGHALNMTALNVYMVGPLKILLAGDLAVKVFMVLSGFVIAHLLLQQRETYTEYVTRRFFRLWPLMMAMILLAIVIQAFYVQAFVDSPFANGPDMRAARVAAEKGNFWTHFGLHLVMLHGLVPESVLAFAPSTFVAPAWSISLEWQFYLVAPALLWTIRNRPWLLLPAVPLAYWATSLDQWQYGAFVAVMIGFFLIGMAMRLVFDILTGKQFPLGGVAVGLLCIAAYVAAVPDAEAALKMAVLAAMLGVFFYLAAVEAGIAKGRLPQWIVRILADNDIARELGKVSYSTYLCHIPMLSLTAGTYFMLGGEGQAGLVVAVALGMVLTIPASFACYRWIEKPGIRLGKKVSGLAPA